MMRQHFAATRLIGGNQAWPGAQEFSPWRTYKSKSVKYAKKLKDETDQIVAIGSD